MATKSLSKLSPRKHRSWRPGTTTEVSIAERPRPASTAALFVSVLLLVAAGVAVYRSSVAAADDDAEDDSTDLDWYHGPGDWHLKDLGPSLANFVTTVQGTLFSR